jgi:hypothetical protein
MLIVGLLAGVFGLRRRRFRFREATPGKAAAPDSNA